MQRHVRLHEGTQSYVRMRSARSFVFVAMRVRWYVGEYGEYDKKVRYEYAVRLGEGIIIDASAAGNAMRFSNHSCDPNARMNKKFDPETGFERVGLYALKHISKGDEITFKYGDKLWFECLCDACVNRT